MNPKAEQVSAALVEELQKNGTPVETVVTVTPQPGPATLTGPVAAQVAQVQRGLNDAQKPGPAGSGKIAGSPAQLGVKPPVPPLTSTKPAGIAATVKAAVRPALGAAPPRPKGIISGNTSDLAMGFFRFVLYSETNATKTTTAARFETPEYVRIIGTRHPEQMVSLKSLGYRYSVAMNWEHLEWLLTYPEAEWPEWAAMPDPDRRRLLLLDDGTEAIQMILDANPSVDNRKTHGEAGKDLRQTLLKKTLWKPYNFGMTALAKGRPSPVRPDEEIYGPNLPPAMLDMVMSDFEFVFYIDKAKKQILTEDESFTYVEEGQKPGEKRTVKRTIYAKTKIDFADVGKGVLEKREPLDLAAIWQRVRLSQQRPAVGAKK